MRLLLMPVAIVLMMTIGPAAAKKPAAAAKPLVGAWHLERYVDTPEKGPPVFAFGEHPVGLFVFTADGHVSIHIMRNPPTAESTSADPDPDACVPTWYCSYFGTYTVEPSGKRWVTHVEGGNIPSFIGTDQPRAFSIKGDRLTISESYVAEGQTFRAERVLVRAR